MTYSVKLKGAVLREFSTAADMDSYLADRIFEWTGLSPQHIAHMGADYVDLVNDRGTTVRLTFTPVERLSLEPDNTVGEWLPFE
jgi:hypothetical protein